MYVYACMHACIGGYRRTSSPTSLRATADEGVKPRPTCHNWMVSICRARQKLLAGGELTSRTTRG